LCITRWVERDRHLGYVVENIVKQDLGVQHREKRQKQRRGGHAGHVAEVGAGPHRDVLQNIVERASPLQHAGMQHMQVVPQRDDVSRFLGHIDRRVHRQADIGRMERRRVVDAIAKIADHMAARLERQDDPVLL
jgi:hypothetical protein